MRVKQGSIDFKGIRLARSGCLPKKSAAGIRIFLRGEATRQKKTATQMPPQQKKEEGPARVPGPHHESKIRVRILFNKLSKRL